MPASSNQNIAMEDNNYRVFGPAHGYREMEPRTPTSIADSSAYDLFGLGAPSSNMCIAPPSSQQNSFTPGKPDRKFGSPQRPVTLPIPSNNIEDSYPDVSSSTFVRGKGSPPYSSDGSSNLDSNVFGTTNSPDRENYDLSEYLTNRFSGLTEQGLSNIHKLHNLNRYVNLPIGFHTPLSTISPRNSDSPFEYARCNHHAAANEDDENRCTNFTWRGELPTRPFRRNTSYSTKVFLGGVPWDITEDVLIGSLSQFGHVKIEWPGKEVGGLGHPRGYVYVIFETENQVKNLLDCCVHDYGVGGNWYYRISTRRMKSKEVQVIPWALTDCTYSLSANRKLDPSKTVFVGALHGMINAEFLFKVMNDIFEGVMYASIDTDKNKYPIGSGRVTFDNKRSYRKAVAANYVLIKTTKFSKKVQIDPYLEDNACSECKVQHGTYFCRDSNCFRYFCIICWTRIHSSGNNDVRAHKPLMRNSRNVCPSLLLTPRY